MISIKSVGAVALFLTSFVAAQNYTVIPSTIDPSLRSAWCDGQLNTCGTLCDGAANPNSCDPDTFVFDCECTANNSAPGLQYYQNTMPTYLCQQIFALCNAGEVSAAGKARCETERRANCGTLNPANYTPTPESTSSSVASTSTTPPTGTGSAAAAPTTTSTSTGLAPTMAAKVGSGVLAVGVAAAFGLML